jgi:hypothetical protein
LQDDSRDPPFLGGDGGIFSADFPPAKNSPPNGAAVPSKSDWLRGMTLVFCLGTKKNLRLGGTRNPFNGSLKKKRIAIF